MQLLYRTPTPLAACGPAPLHLRRARDAAAERGHADTDGEQVRLLERARFAAALDRDLRRACRAEAAGRRAVGAVAGELLRRRAYRHLGFACLGDYTRERLGISARALESAARVATQLEELPVIAAAFARGELSWTQVRVLCGVAGRADEGQWLARARGCTVDQLEALIAAQRDARGGPGAPDPEDDLIDGEPPVALRIACPGRVRCLWRYALEIARRVAGEQLATWQAVECVAAEGIAGRPAGADVGDRVLLVLIRLGRRLRRSVAPADAESPAVTAAESGGTAGVNAAAEPHAGVDDTRGTPAPAVAPDDRSVSEAMAPPAEIVPEAALVPDLARGDAFALDARLGDALRAVKGAEPRIGRLLRMMVDQRLYRTLGFSSADRYVRERLGISLRKAWALLKIEKAA